jgi:hypothetical protein
VETADWPTLGVADHQQLSPSAKARFTYSPLEHGPPSKQEPRPINNGVFPLHTIRQSNSHSKPKIMTWRALCMHFLCFPSSFLVALATRCLPSSLLDMHTIARFSEKSLNVTLFYCLFGQRALSRPQALYPVLAASGSCAGCLISYHHLSSGLFSPYEISCRSRSETIWWFGISFLRAAFSFPASHFLSREGITARFWWF